MFSVFKVRPGELPEDRAKVRDDAAEFFNSLEDEGIVVRGYDVSGLRADADFMIWRHAPSIEALQAAYARFRRGATGKVADAVWSNMACTGPRNSTAPIPAFLAGEAPGVHLRYPFVRSYEWYLLPDEERRKMLGDHGMAAHSYADVRANTVPAFALGDYEWLLAFEAPEMIRIVDLTRDLRATEARMHVREETPFFSGPRVEVTALIDALP